MFLRYVPKCLNPAYKPVGKFHQIYNFVALGDSDDLIGFCNQKITGQGYDQTEIYMILLVIYTLVSLGIASL